jgi:hypothetical protein
MFILLLKPTDREASRSIVRILSMPTTCPATPARPCVTVGEEATPTTGKSRDFCTASLAHEHDLLWTCWLMKHGTSHQGIVMDLATRISHPLRWLLKITGCMAGLKAQAMASGINDYTGMMRSHTRLAQPTAVSTNIHGSLSISQACRLPHHVQMTHRVRMEPNPTEMCLPFNSGIGLPSEVDRPFHVTSAARTAEARIGSVMVYLCSTN